MSDCLIWINAATDWTLRQPEDEDDSTESTGEKTDDTQKAAFARIDKAVSARFGKLERKFKEERESDKAEIAALQKRIETLTDTREEKTEEPGDGSEKLPPGVKALMSKQEKQLAKIQSQLDEATRESVSKDLAMKLKDRKHTVESKLHELGAVRSEQAYRILSDMIVEDGEIGDAIKVKTEHGDDLVPVVEYLPTFKEENPYLFTPAAKSGSGAGGGGASASKPHFTPETLVDPKKGGMSWEEYDKNRDKIHHDFEEKAGV